MLSTLVLSNENRLLALQGETLTSTDEGEDVTVYNLKNYKGAGFK